VNVAPLLRLGMPLALGLSLVATWLLTRNKGDDAGPATGWRDDSLDDWRKQRDQEYEERRRARLGEEPDNESE
jgi:hypothetical protein